MSPPLPPVVLIDDNPDDLFLTRQILRKAGVENPVMTANSGEEAIELFRDFTTGKKLGPLPRFVLCDVRMPGADGFQVLQWFRSQPRFNEVFFAMHTGGNEPADRVRAQTLHADDFLVKFPTLPEMQRIAASATRPRPPSE